MIRKLHTMTEIEHTEFNFDPDILLKIILGAWVPAAMHTELISHQDVMSYVNTLSEAMPEDVYKSMTEYGFQYKNIDNALYWLIEGE